MYKTVKEEEPKHAIPPLLFFKTSITLRAKIEQGKLIGFRHIAKQSQITHQFYCCIKVIRIDLLSKSDLHVFLQHQNQQFVLF